MDETLRAGWMSAEEEHRISEEIGRERQRLRNFIRRRVADESDVDDILQEVFYELIESYRLMKPVEKIGAWLFRVATNRITDLFRRKKTPSISAVAPHPAEADEQPGIDELLPSPEAEIRCGPRKKTIVAGELKTTVASTSE